MALYACYIQNEHAWRFSCWATNAEEVEGFIAMAEDMMKSRRNGRPVIGYDVHELKSKANPEIEVRAVEPKRSE